MFSSLQPIYMVKAATGAHGGGMCAMYGSVYAEADSAWCWVGGVGSSVVTSRVPTLMMCLLLSSCHFYRLARLTKIVRFFWPNDGDDPLLRPDPTDSLGQTLC